MDADRRTTGFTLVEMGVLLGIAAVLASLAMPSMLSWIENQRLGRAARVVDGAISYARSEAIRTGNIYLVFIGEDAQGNVLQDAGGNDVDLLVVDDGRVGTANQNCQIDAGERRIAMVLESGVSWGLTHATSKVGTDMGLFAVTDGSTFRDAGGNAATWVLFRPEGPPRPFSADCTVGAVGTGGGGFYFTNGDRDMSVVLTPIGSTRLHTWAAAGGGWSS